MSHTVIVIQEEAVLAVSGKTGKKPQIHQMEREVLTGFGDSFGQWRTALSNLRQKMDCSHVRLVLPPSMCATKTVALPFAKGKELDQIVSRELTELRNKIKDYTVIKASKRAGMSVCLGSVEEPILNNFLDICDDLDISVDSVTVPMEAYEKVLDHISEAENESAIFLFFEEGGLTSVLYSEGQYVYSSRSRLFSEPGTYDYAAEIVRCVSGIVQFNSASKVQHEITNVYYAGYPESEFALSMEGIQAMGLMCAPMSSVRDIKMSGAGDLSVYNVCAGAMFGHVSGMHDMNLLAMYRKEIEEEKTEKKTAWWKHLMPIAATGVVALGIYGGLMAVNGMTQSKIDSKNDWMNSAMTQEQYIHSLQLNEEVTSLKNAIHSVELTNQNIETYPEIRTEMINRLQNVGGAGITLTMGGYDADQGPLSFAANSRDVIDIPSYVQALEKTGLFYNVSYTGYRYNESSGYTLSLSCILMGTDIEDPIAMPAAQDENGGES